MILHTRWDFRISLATDDSAGDEFTQTLVEHFGAEPIHGPFNSPGTNDALTNKPQDADGNGSDNGYSKRLPPITIRTGLTISSRSDGVIIGPGRTERIKLTRWSISTTGTCRR